MSNITKLFSHTVNITRASDIVLTASTIPFDTTLALSYPNQPVKMKISRATVFTIGPVIEVIGQFNNVAVTSTVTLTNTIYVKTTSESFDTITRIHSLSGSGGSIIVQGVSEFGQPVKTISSVINSWLLGISQLGVNTGLTSLPVRITSKRVPGGNLTGVGLSFADTIIMYSTIGEDAILVKDVVTDIKSNIDYIVKDINHVYDRSKYHHSEIILSKNDE